MSRQIGAIVPQVGPNKQKTCVLPNPFNVESYHRRAGSKEVTTLCLNACVSPNELFPTLELFFTIKKSKIYPRQFSMSLVEAR